MATLFSTQVREFSSLAGNLPKTPTIASKQQIKFIIRMVMSEMAELAVTQVDHNSIHEFLHECVNEIDVPKKITVSDNEVEVIAEQQDAIADAIYYCVDWSARRGVNIGTLLEVIHQSNMDKKWSDGKFHVRDDGKVMKPIGWKAPDIYNVIENAISNESSVTTN